MRNRPEVDAGCIRPTCDLRFTVLTLVLVLVLAAVFALVIVPMLAPTIFALVIVLGLAALAVVTTASAAVVIGLSGRGGLRGRSRTRSRAGEADPLQIFEHSLPDGADLRGALLG
jgi:hypothetical protein